MRATQIWKQHKNHIITDMLAGATGAVAGAPQAMGFAIVAGISPLYGLYTAIVATIIGALTTDSVYMTVGPTNAVSLVVGSALIPFLAQDPIGHLFALTLLVGLFQLLFGVLRLGALMRFVSNAVMTGFISGAAILIILGQLSHLVGLHDLAQGNSLYRFSDWIIHLPQANLHTSIVGVMALIIIYKLHHTRFRSVATLVAMIVTSILIAALGWTDVAVVRDMSPIPGDLPGLVMPNLLYIPEIASAALAIALLASLQASGITRSVPQPDGSVASVKRDLIGQGLANIAGGFFQCMPSGGSLSRTAVNISAGAFSRLANVIAAVLVAAVLLLLGGLIERIPLAALSGHLIIAALSLLRPQMLAVVWRVSRSARIAMVVTFASTLLFPLEFSIYIGVFISLLLYVHSSATDIVVARLVPAHNGHFKEEPIPEVLPVDEPVIVSVSGNLYFAAISRLEELLPLPDSMDIHPVIILRLRNNQYLGSTGIRFLQDYARKLSERGGRLILAGVGERVRGQLERTGACEVLDPVFFADDVIFSATERAFDYAKAWLHEKYDHANAE